MVLSKPGSGFVFVRGTGVITANWDRQELVIIPISHSQTTKTEPDFIKLSKILKSPLLPFLYRYFNFSPRFILPKSFGAHKLSTRLLGQYTSHLPTSRNETAHWHLPGRCLMTRVGLSNFGTSGKQFQTSQHYLLGESMILLSKHITWTNFSLGLPIQQL